MLSRSFVLPDSVATDAAKIFVLRLYGRSRGSDAAVQLKFKPTSQNHLHLNDENLQERKGDMLQFIRFRCIGSL